MAYGLPSITPSHLAALLRSKTILKNRYGYGDPRTRRCEQEIKTILDWSTRSSELKTYIVYFDTCDRNGQPNGDYDKEWANAYSRYEAAEIVARRNWNVYNIKDVLISR